MLSSHLGTKCANAFVVCTNQGLAKTKVTGDFENILLVFVFASVFVFCISFYFVQMHWNEIRMRCPGQEHGIVCLHPLFSDNLNVSPQPNVFASSISSPGEKIQTEIFHSSVT